MKRVLIFRAELLPRSETFILEQNRALQRYEPFYAGARRTVGGQPIDPAISFAVTAGGRFRDKLARRAFILTLHSPKLEQWSRKVHPELIHAHFAPDACLANSLHRALGIPMITTLHGYDVAQQDSVFQQSLEGRMYLRRRPELWRQASLFLCVSEHIRQTAIERGFPAEKLVVHRIGIDLTRFLPAERHEPIVLFVGRMVEKKGAIHLIRAMQGVQQRQPDARLVLLGDGALRGQLEEEARSLGVKAEFLGMQTHTDVRNWMQRAQILAAPSLVAANGDSEGLPTVMCEAQAMGLPVVSFRGPGVDEAVVHGETALLATPKDERDLGEAISTLLGDANMRKAFGEAGHRRAAELFDIRRQTALLEDIYDRVLEGTGVESLDAHALGEPA